MNLIPKNQKFLVGADFSHHNYPFELNPALLDFIWLKATEGSTWKDPKLGDMAYAIAREVDLDRPPFMGLYHYCRPENNNSPATEMENFIQEIDRFTPEYNTMVALDVEGGALSVKYIDNWVSEAVDILTEKYKKPIVVYVQASATHLFKKTSEKSVLWLAHYVKSNVSVRYHSWDNIGFWQFTNAPFDFNLFLGTRNDLHALATGKGVI